MNYRTSILAAQSHDVLLHHKNPMVLRMGDHEHRHINVGDIVHLEGHNSIMDRQRFQVVAKMKHPTLQAALNHVEKSNVALRDKLGMREAFLGFHGREAEHHSVTSIHLAPHPSSAIGGQNHSVSM